jgi:hypothetical protein
MGTGAGAEAHHSHWGTNLDPRRSIILNEPGLKWIQKAAAIGANATSI